MMDIDSNTPCIKRGDRWYIALASDLAEYAAADHRSRAFIAATWVVMPPWWSPEQRFAFRPTDSCEICAGFANQRPTDDPRDAADVPESHWERVTASLETGEEVPA